MSLKSASLRKPLSQVKDSGLQGSSAVHPTIWSECWTTSSRHLNAEDKPTNTSILEEAKPHHHCHWNDSAVRILILLPNASLILLAAHRKTSPRCTKEKKVFGSKYMKCYINSKTWWAWRQLVHQGAACCNDDLHCASYRKQLKTPGLLPQRAKLDFRVRTWCHNEEIKSDQICFEPQIPNTISLGELCHHLPLTARQSLLYGFSMFLWSCGPRMLTSNLSEFSIIPFNSTLFAQHLLQSKLSLGAFPKRTFWPPTRYSGRKKVLLYEEEAVSRTRLRWRDPAANGQIERRVEERREHIHNTVHSNT